MDVTITADVFDMEIGEGLSPEDIILPKRGHNPMGGSEVARLPPLGRSSRPELARRHVLAICTTAARTRN